MVRALSIRVRNLIRAVGHRRDPQSVAVGAPDSNPRKVAVEGRQGDRQEVVLRLPEHLAFLLEDADDRVSVVPEEDALVDRVLAGEELLADFVSDHDHVRRVLDVEVRDESALRDGSARRGRVLGDDAVDARRLCLRVPILQVVVGVVPEITLRRHGARLGDARFEGRGVFQRQVLAPQLAFRMAAGTEPRLVLLNHHERGAVALEAPHHVVVEARHDRDHRDHRRDADDDSEDRQRRAQLVGAHREEREPHVLAEAAAQVGQKAVHRVRVTRIAALRSGPAAKPSPPDTGRRRCRRRSRPRAPRRSTRSASPPAAPRTPA